MSNAGSETSSEPLQKYHPFQLGPSEDLEWYEPGGFHPVHLRDVYDLRYSIVHKLGFGGFSTVWLAHDSVEDEWVALKILASETSTTSTARPSILADNDIKSSTLFFNTETRILDSRPKWASPVSRFARRRPQLLLVVERYLRNNEASSSSRYW